VPVTLQYGAALASALDVSSGMALSDPEGDLLQQATVRIAAGARWTAPPAQAGTRRQWYVFQGQGLRMAGQPVAVKSAVEVRAQDAIEIANGDSPSELLMLQGRPLNEPVAQYGPFVMNTRAEIEQAFEDYRRTEFGGWPWQGPDPVHAREKGRFALHADGQLEER
jgi:redox-sensitive bicupin YhaK (pirin superfamily)